VSEQEVVVGGMQRIEREICNAIDSLTPLLVVTLELHHGANRTIGEVATLLATTRATVDANIKDATERVARYVGSKHAHQANLRQACQSRICVRTAKYHYAQRVQGLATRLLLLKDAGKLSRTVTSKVLADDLSEMVHDITVAIRRLSESGVLLPGRPVKIVDEAALRLLATAPPEITGVIRTWERPVGKLLFPQLSDITFEDIQTILHRGARQIAAQLRLDARDAAADRGVDEDGDEFVGRFELPTLLVDEVAQELGRPLSEDEHRDLLSTVREELG
jgi:predicted transcriptional regulator